jgi:hypothetical protein
MNISSGIKTVRSVITANSPVLLLGTSIAGIVATGILAAKGGYKARGIIDDATADKGEPLTVQEKVQLTWLCYAVPGVTAASTIASSVGMHTIHTKRANAMAALYAVTAGKLDDYQDKAEELLGTKKTQQLNNELAQKTIDGNPLENNEIILTGNGTELMYDDWSGRYFDGSVAVVEAAVNEINRQLIDDGEASLNDYYDHVGLPPIPMGVRFGWTGGDKVDIRFGGAKTKDDRAAVTCTFRKEPKDNLGKY